MNLISKFSVFIFLCVLALSCKKDKDPQNQDNSLDVQKITLTTNEAVFRSDNSIRTGGKASIDLSKYSHLEYGVCFGEEENPTINDNVSISGTSSGGDFESIIGEDKFDLDETLFIRAYVKNKSNNSIKYGNQIKANLDDDPGSSLDVQSITLSTLDAVFRSDNSIRTGGTASIDLSKYDNLDFGVCYGYDPNPTISDNVSFSFSTTGLSYEAIVNNYMLELNKPIYIRAFVANRGSVKYGNQVIAEKRIELKINTVRNISVENFTVDITVGSGLNEMRTVGFAFGTNPNPTTSNYYNDIPSNSPGSYTITSEGSDSHGTYPKLQPGKVYYIRPYVLYGSGPAIVFGEEISFRLAGYTGGSGGIVFYDKGSTSNGWRYLEAAPYRLAYESEETFSWDCGIDGNVVANTGSNIGDGQSNSSLMFDQCPYTDNVGAVAFMTNVNGKNDWFLPSLEEWKLLGKAYEKEVINMENGTYWTSSQANTNNAHAIIVNDRYLNEYYTTTSPKSTFSFGWPIRKF